MDVASYVLQRTGPVTAMKLQKLVYYCQTWSLVWDDEPIFLEKIEAWANGPVCPKLHYYHRGKFKVDAENIPGNFETLNATQRETVGAVLEFYGKQTPHWLSELTHKERPWSEARGNLPPGERGSQEITHEAMAEYYGSL